MFTFSRQKFDNVSYEKKLSIVNSYSNKLTTSDLLKNRIISCCPYCNSNNFIKHGKYNELQRYKCSNSNCKRTFSQKTKTLFSYSKKSAYLWIKYFILLNNGKSLRECSSILNINLATAFYWRHKILVTQNKNYFNILKNYVEVSKVIITENFKGNRNVNYLDKKQVFIACAMDSNKTLLSKVISKYTISLKDININFSYNIDKHAILSAYNDRYFQVYSSKHNSFLLPIENSNISNIIYELNKNNILGTNNSNLNNIRNLNLSLPNKCLFIHSFSLKIKKWLMRFRGVATKYLENYLNWHIMEFKNEYRVYTLNQINLFKDFLKETSYIRIKDFSNYKLQYQYNN
ncbi:MAG: IS1 family transposase [Clostridium sartagoforme]|nr:IS1 family transposase [Clostridium sartagoforme]